ncbi:hypothetical protein HEK616_33770 [Streptomyces nigrescens]|uniref:Uncharacterized protein n=1 Tax=Streptomyces nigrescens TaxID=1920 RepID=A0ABN6QYJ9_STRNI|nr:hypothetical protein HEK616_33770 [Streptomyces nigrescens]
MTPHMDPDRHGPDVPFQARDRSGGEESGGEESGEKESGGKERRRHRLHRVVRRMDGDLHCPSSLRAIVDRLTFNGTIIETASAPLTWSALGHELRGRKGRQPLDGRVLSHLALGAPVQRAHQLEHLGEPVGQLF